MARRKKRQDGRLERAFRFNGKVYHVYGRNAEELSIKEREKRRELEKGFQAHYNPTLNQYYDRFTEIRLDKVKENTLCIDGFLYRCCASVMLPNINKKLGDMHIKDIKPKDLQQVQAILTKGDKSTTTINEAFSHLNHVFREAVKDETIERNPCIAVKRLKRIEPKARDTIHRALTIQETRAFFEAAEGSYYYNALAMMLQTGLRIGELAALTETDVDKQKGLLHVSRTITRGEYGGFFIGDSAKTESGRRDIPLTPDIIRIIQQQKLLNMQMFNGSTTIFRAVEGGLLLHKAMNEEIRKICKAAGVERFTCHALRATFATRFIEQRPQDYKALSEILGHSNINITLNLYTHVMNETKTEAMNGIRIAY